MSYKLQQTNSGCDKLQQINSCCVCHVDQGGLDSLPCVDTPKEG